MGEGLGGGDWGGGRGRLRLHSGLERGNVLKKLRVVNAAASAGAVLLLLLLQSAHGVGLLQLWFQLSIMPASKMTGGKSCSENTEKHI